MLGPEIIKSVTIMTVDHHDHQDKSAVLVPESSSNITTMIYQRHVHLDCLSAWLPVSMMLIMSGNLSAEMVCACARILNVHFCTPCHV